MKNGERGPKPATSNTDLAIYAYLLDARHVRGLSTFAYVPQIRGGKIRLTSSSSSKPFNFSLAILRTNKQIHCESLHIFHSTNLFIRISLYKDDIYWTQALLEGSQLGFVSSNLSRLSTITIQALDVEVSMEDSRHLRCQVVFPALYLPRFIDLLESMCTGLPQWSCDHSINLSLRHKYRSGPLATENLLLEPWRALHGIHEVVVDTNIVSPSFAQSLRTSMMGTKWDPWTWLESVRRQKEVGSAEMRRGPQYPALKAAGEEFDKAVNRLRLQCELNIILAVTKTLTNLALAAGASDRALDLLSGKSGAWTNSAPQMPRNHMSWYTEVDIAKVRYRRGCLCMELCFAAENMAMLDGVRNELMYAQALNPGARGAVDKVLNVLETRRKIRELEEK
ncbi:hypothetical protein IMSHALPRED_001921 [Imshaugia aleurites]|uniref:Uncharacterized protein n=1 Tax=Imshaugia aleurites TaxID=172621 RepID=A0A8H3IG21_9LECA|nr:hypothetical protein IMSHALPRED_001921 [Imshaugia aleurites]